MQVSLTIKECKKCGTSYYGGSKEITLTERQQVELIVHQVRDCPFCPEDTGPRTAGYRKL